MDGSFSDVHHFYQLCSSFADKIFFTLVSIVPVPRMFISWLSLPLPGWDIRFSQCDWSSALKSSSEYVGKGLGLKVELENTVLIWF